MALLTPLPLDEARMLCAAFGLDVTAIEPLPDGSVNSNFRLCTSDGRRWFARLYEEQGTEGAALERRVALALSGEGVPTVVQLASTSGQMPVHQGKPFAVYPWIAGEILCQARVTEGACARLGSALARVHLAAVPELPAGRFRVEDLAVRLDRAEREGGDALFDPVQRVRAEIAKWVALREPSLPSGLIHGDLFRDNVLWHGDEIAALIDFESACQGAYVYDLGVCVHAWCYGDAFAEPLVAALLAGYHAVRPLSETERAALPVEGAIGALRFASTRMTDYSLRAPPGQPPKRDYRRFLSRLAAIEAGAWRAPLAALRDR